MASSPEALNREAVIFVLLMGISCGLTFFSFLYNFLSGLRDVFLVFEEAFNLQYGIFIFWNLHFFIEVDFLGRFFLAKSRMSICCCKMSTFKLSVITSFNKSIPPGTHAGIRHQLTSTILNLIDLISGIFTPITFS